MCEDALARLRLLQVIVDRDERLDRLSWVRVELDLSVVQRFGVRVAPLRQHAKLADVDGQWPIGELHELGEVE